MKLKLSNYDWALIGSGFGGFGAWGALEAARRLSERPTTFVPDKQGSPDTGGFGYEPPSRQPAAEGRP